MNHVGLTRVAAQKAQDIARRFSLGDDARELLGEGLTPRQYLDLLLEKQQFPDATRFLAHGLPKQEAVWWACLCARQTQGANPAPKATAALQAAEQWVKDPSEDNRRAALPAAEAADFGTPAGCAAIAAFWSGGSMGPPNVPTIPPGEYLTALAVAGVVMLAAVLTEPERAPDKFRRFLTLGIEVANGSERWK